MKPPEGITQLLVDWGKGDRAALEKLMPLVYSELRRLASNYLRRERVGHTLQPTALVNEAYLRLVGGKRVDWQGRAHFFAIAARVMRRILVDIARSQRPALQVSLEEAPGIPREHNVDLVALDDALRALAELDPRESEIVELYFFGGLKVGEIAGVLNISSRTVERELSSAKAWLNHELGGRQEGGRGPGARRRGKKDEA